MKLPNNINPCPIVDALLDLRFETKVNRNAVFGIIYSVLKDRYPNVDNLPILQLPEHVLSRDESLKYRPYFKISNNDFVVQIGPNVLTIGSYPKYLGWKKFSAEIDNVIDLFLETGVIDTLNRVGLRYVNFFEGNVFDKLNLEVKVNNKEIGHNSTIIKTVITEGGFSNILQLTNQIDIKGRTGTLIDIDTFKTTINIEDFNKNKTNLISQCHDVEKTIFFGLLKPQFLDSLNPEY